MSTLLISASTASSDDIYATLRNALLNYESSNGQQSVKQLCDGREPVYVNRAPDSPAFPYITLRLDRVSLPAYNGYREEFMFEVQVLGKPSSQMRLVEQLADVVDAVFFGYLESGSGLMFSRSRSRTSLPMFNAPADKEVVGVVMRFTIKAWPRVLTDLRPN